MTYKKTIVAILIASVVILMLNWQLLAFKIIYLTGGLYDQNFYEKNFEVEDGQIYRKDTDSGKRYPVMRTFREDFENAKTLVDFISIKRGWTNFTLLSPKAPTITAYNQLKNQILSQKKDFLDNRLEPSSEQAHLGQQSLRALAVAPTSGMTCTKASLHTTLLHFVKGDDVWFSAWYYFEKAGTFHTIMDLETTFVRNHPGIRICFNQGYLYFELAKWVPKSIYRQSYEKRIPFPIKRWVHVKFHLRLSDKKDGLVQLWQDDTLIIDQRGQTLPFAEAIYNDLEIGLNAHSEGPDAAILYVDDLMISAEHTLD